MKPEGVRNAAAEADARIQQMAAEAGDTAAPDTGSTDGQADTGDSRVVDFAAAQPRHDDPGTAEGSEIEALRVELEHERREREKAESRHRTLEGMFRATNEKLEGLRELLAASQQQRSQPQEPQQAPPAEKFSQQDADQFGEDLCEYVESRVAAGVGKLRQELMGQLGDMRAKVDTTSTVVAKTQQQVFHETLDKLLPKWREIDNDPEFVEFLQADSLYGPAWSVAVESLDAQSAAKIMRVWQGMQNNSPAAQHDQRVQKQLETSVAPERTRTESAAPPSNRSEPRQWRMSEIRAVYADLSLPPSQRKYSAKDFEALEKDIAKAQSENRVIYD